MASLQARKVRGHTYWHIVESRRVNGKPRPVPVAYLGKADDLLARLNAADTAGALRLHSRSHGAVAALWALTQELDIAGIIDGQLAASGRRVSGADLSAAKAHRLHARPPSWQSHQSESVICNASSIQYLPIPYQ